MTSFTWRDGDRTIRFGEGAGGGAWPGADLLTTARAQRDIPAAVVSSAARVHHVPAGQVPDAAAALIDAVAGADLVAWGGGRVVDTAKAIAAARGGRVCAVPTTLSGAEMTRGHRPAPGFESAPRHRPVLVLADPALMTGQPEVDRRASAMNALAHAAESTYVPGRNPVASLAAAAAAGLLAAGLEAGRGDDLALGATLAGYALDSTGLGLHHVICQTIVRTCGTPHAATNAAMLPHVLGVMAGRDPEALEPVARALGVALGALPGRVAALAGGGRRLSELGVDRGSLPAVAEAAARREELAGLPEPATREQLVRLLEEAY
jgi:alcohol dehydrogenase class IV